MVDVTGNSAGFRDLQRALGVRDGVLADETVVVTLICEVASMPSGTDAPAAASHCCACSVRISSYPPVGTIPGSMRSGGRTMQISNCAPRVRAS